MKPARKKDMVARRASDEGAWPMPQGGVAPALWLVWRQTNRRIVMEVTQ